MLRSACGLLLPSLVLAFGSTPTMRSACGLLLPPLVLAFGSTPTAQRGFILAGGMGQPYGTPDRNLLLVSDGIGGPFSVVTNASGRRLQRQGRGLLDPSLDRVGRLLPSAAAPPNVPSREKIAGESGFGNTFALVAGDFNMDGVDDVVIGNADAYNDEGELPSANQILFGCKNDPDCVFHWTFSLPAGSNPPGFTERNTRGLAACDVDLDGSLDIIVANYDTYNNGMGSQVLRNTGEPPSGFDAEDLLTNNKPDFMGFLHLAIACGDLNDDGYPDIVVGSQMAPNEILLNDGTGHFPEATTFASDAEGASLTTALSIGDVNNDGRPDIVVGNGGYEPTPSFVYLNEGEVECARAMVRDRTLCTHPPPLAGAIWRRCAASVQWLWPLHRSACAVRRRCGRQPRRPPWQRQCAKHALERGRHRRL